MTPDESAKFDAYSNLLRKWSATINLIAPSTLQDIRGRHIEDSLQLIRLIPLETKYLLDIGSGAGFPGMVIAMMRPDIVVHLVESDTRKCSFLQAVSRETATPVIIHNTRVESVDMDTAPQLITARALAPLDKLFAMTSRWWTENPTITLLFPKGENWAEEVALAETKYDFSLGTHTSITDPAARILRIAGVTERK